MIKRTLTAVLGIPLLVFIVNSGGGLLVAASAAMTLIALNEYIKAYEIAESNKGRNSDYSLYRAWLWLIAILSYGLIFLKGSQIQLEVPILFVMVLGLAIIDISKDSSSRWKSREMLYGYIYVVVFFRFIYYAAQFENKWVVWLIFLIAWSTDTFAYFAGRAFGKHKLAPEISPKKTVEGALGGIFGATASTVAFSVFFVPELAKASILIGMAGSVVSQVGDLTASMIKRHCGVKDFGKVMPGHGGVLDRFDSILFTAPFIYAIYIILNGSGVIR